MLNVDELAELFGVARCTVSKWIRRGELKANKEPIPKGKGYGSKGWRYVVFDDEIDRFMQSKTYQDHEKYAKLKENPKPIAKVKPGISATPLVDRMNKLENELKQTKTDLQEKVEQAKQTQKPEKEKLPLGLSVRVLTQEEKMSLSLNDLLKMNLIVIEGKFIDGAGA